RPFSLASTGNSVIMEVSRSLAVIVRVLSFISKRKFSRMGTTGLLVTTPFILDNCFNRAEEETINFIMYSYNVTWTKLEIIRIKLWHYYLLLMKNTGFFDDIKIVRICACAGNTVLPQKVPVTGSELPGLVTARTFSPPLPLPCPVASI